MKVDENKMKNNMNKSVPFFSVIIPTYNRAKLLVRTIKSVLSQTFDDFELIIIDDGSTDDTSEVVNRINDNRIIYRHKENGGPNSAYNIGFKIAKGKVIALLDSDDWWLPEKLEYVYEVYTNEPEVGIVYHWGGYEIDGEIKLLREDRFEGECYEKVLGAGYLTSPTFLTFRAECLSRILPLDEKILHNNDDDLCYLLTKYYKVKVVKKILAIYSIIGDDRLMKNCTDDKAFISELHFWNKWCIEIVQAGFGARMIERYMRLSTRALISGNIEISTEAYDRALKLSRE